MPKRSINKRPTDLNKLAASIVGDAVDESIEPVDSGKNPAAVALGRLGGKIGGKARAKNLTKEQLSEIGKAGAKARWEKKNNQN